MAGTTASDTKKSIEASPGTIEPAPPSPSEQPRNREKLEAATKVVREFVEPINSNLEFSVDGDTGELVVKIIDRATKEVIRQMPSEEMLAIAKTLDNIKGLFVKQTA
jgi:flagellar protein FlaG